MRPVCRQTLVIGIGIVFMLLFVFMTAGNLALGNIAASGTLTPTAWVYLPYIAQMVTSTPTLTPTPTPTPTSTPIPTAQPVIEIVEHSGATYYLLFSQDIYGDKHARGIVEVRNNSACIRALVQVRMDIISNLTAQITSYTEIWDLRPGQSSPVVFSALLPSSFNFSGAYANVTIVSEGYCTTNDGQSGLSVYSQAGEPIVPGAWQVWGSVTNNTGAVQDVEVVGWARYSQEHPGLITGVDSEWVYDIPHGSTRNFPALHFSGPPGGQLDYEVVAQR